MIGQHPDSRVVDVGRECTVARSVGLAEAARSRTDLDAADEAVVVSDTDEPRTLVSGCRGVRVEAVVELTGPQVEFGG